MSLDPSHDKSLQKMFYQHYSNLYEGGLGAGDNDLCAEDMKKLLTNCVYLEDSWISLYGYKIYGSPWTPEYGSMGFRYLKCYNSTEQNHCQFEMYLQFSKRCQNVGKMEQNS